MSYKCQVCKTTLQEIRNKLGWCDVCKCNTNIFNEIPAPAHTNLETEFRDYKNRTEKRIGDLETRVKKNA